MKTLLTIPLLLASVLIAFSATGEIYKWVDDQGNIHFTDRPPPNQTKEKIEVKINSYTSPTIRDIDSLFGNTEKIVMYSTSWCGYCRRARNYFEANKIAFEEYDVETTYRGKRDYQKLGANGVPIILMGEKRMNGFSVSKFERFYQDNRKQ